MRGHYAADSLTQRRLWPLAIVLLLHGVLGWALLIVVGVAPEPTLLRPITAQLLSDLSPVISPASPPHPPASRPQRQIAPAVSPPVARGEAVTQAAAHPAIAPEGQHVAPDTTAPFAPAKASAPPAVAGKPVRIAAQVDSSRCTKPPYPPASRQLEEEGTVKLQFLVNERGGVKDVTILRSSGFARLDNAAREALRLCRFRPAFVDANPVESLQTLDYRWELTDE